MKLHIKEQSLVFFKSMNSSSLKCVFICIRVSLPFCLCVYHEILQRPDNGLESLLTELTVSFFFLYVQTLETKLGSPTRAASLLTTESSLQP